MGKTNAMKWIPLDVDSWLYGSTRLELAADECAVWIDFLALGAKDNGFIRANVGFPYPIPRLAGLLGRDVELVERTIGNCLKTHTMNPDERPKLTRLDDGTLYITNWESYQFSDRWIRKLNKMNESPVKSDFPEPCSGNRNPIISSNVISSSSSHKRKSDIAFNHDKHEWEGIEAGDIDEWAKAYPAVIIDLELKQMAQWIISNPAKGHKSRWRAFITNWLKRQQDRGGSMAGRRVDEPIPGRDVGKNQKREWTIDEWQRTRDHIEMNVRAEGMKKVTAGSVTMDEFNRRVREVMAEWDKDYPRPGK